MADHDDTHNAARASNSQLPLEVEEWQSKFGAVVDSVAQKHRLSQYVADERSATKIRSYESELIPGLLQVPAYVRAITRIYFADATEAEQSKLVEARLARAALLDRSDAPPQFSVLLAEEALRRQWDPPAARREQLDALTEELDGGRPHVKLRIVPMRVAQSDAAPTAFVVMSLRDGSEVLWREGRHDSERVVDPVQIGQAVESLEHLTHAAYEQSTARDLIKEIRESLG